MKKFKYILFLIIFSSFSLFASQGGNNGSDYMWTDMQGTDTVTTYDWIDIRDANAAIQGPFNSSDNPVLVNIGFNFSFYGKNHTQIYASPMGWLSFSDVGSSVPGNLSIPSGSAPDSMIAVYWDNLINDVGTGGVFYETIGTAPNRKFIVQWYANDFGGGPGVIEFQVILYETSNLIKFQYGYMDVGYNNGNSATVGLQNTDSDALEYSFNSGIILPNRAILFHGEGVSSADATISPTTVNINTLQQFNYTIDNISPFTDGLGKIDTVSIDIPVEFSASPIVTQIDVNSASTFIQNSTSKPTEGGFATWNFSGNAIQIQTADFEVINSLDVTYYLQTPGTPTPIGSPVDFTSSFGAILDTNDMQSTTEVEYSVNIDAVVDYYGFTPANDTSFIAGNSLDYVITAYDQFGTPIANSDSVIVSQIGTTGIIYTPNNRLGFAGNSTVNVTISKDSVETFTLKAVKKADASVSGTSGLITIKPAAVDSISVLSSTSSIRAGAERTLRVVLLDQYLNSILSGSIVSFTRISAGDGGFSGSPGTTDATNSNGEAEAVYTASTVSGGNDVIRVSFGSVTEDITLPVTVGDLAEIRIQTIAGDGGAELDDLTMTTDDDTTVYIEGYDALGNHIPGVSATWGGTGVVTGDITSGPSASAIFTPSSVGSGKITAIVGALNDISGTIIVNPGVTTSVKIMDEPGGGGSVVTVSTMQVGDVLNLYANGFDAEDNFTSNISVTWGINGAGLDPLDLVPNPGSNTTFIPKASGIGRITASGAYPLVQTNNFSVLDGSLSRLEIRTAASLGGEVLGDAVFYAGDNPTFYAAGYDLYDNYIDDFAVNWTIEKVDGDSIGFFTDDTRVDQNEFNARIVNSGRIRIDTTVSGTPVTAYSGTIKIKNGLPTNLAATTGTTFSGSAGSTLADSIGVRLTDAYGNYVPDSTIQWTALTGGSLNPGSSVTNSDGVARTKWTLKSDITGEDSVLATFGALTPVEFTANVNASDANQMSVFGAGGVQSGVVNTDVPLPLVVLVEDQFGTPVPDVPITFSVVSSPDTNFAFSNPVDITDANGRISTNFTLGKKKGTYVVNATNAPLSGSPVVFTLTANADVVDHLVMFSGDEQTGTVNNPLSNNVIVKAEDQFGNAVQGVNIIWNASPGASFNDLGSTLTDANGRDASQWTLSTNAGRDSITATVVSLNTITFRATANADAPANITMVSGNNTTAVAGGNQLLQARVTDQHGNNVSGSLVSFTPAIRMSALNNVSDANGLVSAVYRTPANESSSTALATLSGVGSASFTVYGLTYDPGSLSPKAVTSGSSVDFYIDVINPNPVNPVTLDLAASNFVINYNNTYDTTTVASPLTIPANGTTTIQFNSLTINGTFPSGSYTPTITLVNSDSSMSGSFTTDPSELSIDPLEITSIILEPPGSDIFTRGETIEIRMNVRNNSPTLTMDNFSPSLSILPNDAGTPVQTGGPSSLAPGASSYFTFNLTILPGAGANIKTIDGSITGEFAVSNEPVFDNNSAVTETFEVIESADLTWLSYTPLLVSENQTVTFTATVQNDGLYDILLNKNNSFIAFDTDTFNLTSNQSLEGNSASSVLTFVTNNITESAGSHTAILNLQGTEEGNPFSMSFSSDTLGAINSLTIQTAADLVFQANPTLSSLNVSQGQTGQTFQFTVRNDGQATVRINSLDSIIVLVDGSDISGSSDYQTTFTSGQTFPINILSGASQTFIFTMDVNDNATVVGTPDVFSAQIVYSDINSSTVSSETSIVNPSWTILAKSAFSITSITAAHAQVTQGQIGRTVTVRVTNTGGVAAQVDTVYLQFERNVSTFTPVLPASIAGGAFVDIVFTGTIDATAATGIDQIRAVAVGTNNLSGETISTTSPYLDSWEVLSAGKISINAVTSPFSMVNRGQQDVPVTVSITNNGQSSVTINSLDLNNSPAGATSNTRITPISSILAGQTLNFSFQSDINALAADTVLLGAQFAGTDDISGDPVTTSTVAIADTFFVDNPSMLEIDSVYASFYTFTQGQSNLDVRVEVRNTGTSNIKLDSLKLILSSIDPIDAGNTLGFNQIAPTQPNLPTLTAGASTVVLFRLTSPTAIPDSGIVQIDAQAFATDVLSQTPANALSATIVETVLMQTPANPLAVQITNPDTVSVGETNITVDVLIENQGGATSRIDNVSLNFFNASLQNRNQDYSRDYPLTPALPFNLAGGNDTTITFTIGVLENPETGTINLGASVQSTELNRNLPKTNSNSTLSTWDVIGNGLISILSVSSDRDTVSAGHTGIPIEVTVRNDGDTQVRVDSIAIKFSRGTYTSTYATFTSGNILAPTAQNIFQVNVGIDAGSVSGVSTIDAEVYGRDTENSVDVSKIGADTGDSWLIQKRVNLSITDNMPTTVSTDQSFSHQVVVRNTGEARLVIDSTATILYPSSTPANFVKLASGTPLVIEGNQTVTLPFLSTSSATPFTDNIELDLFGTENGDLYNQQIIAPNQLTVQNQAAMVILSTTAAKDSVSQGDNPTVSVTVSNAGQAGLEVNTLNFTEYGAFTLTSPTLPDIISGGGSTTYTGTIDVTALTSTGNVLLDVTGTGRDVNSNDVVSDLDGADDPDSIFVTTAPAIDIIEVTSTETMVSRGQNGLIINVTIVNDGETPVDLTALTLEPAKGDYSQTPGPLGRLNGGDTTIISVTVDVDANSVIGTDQIFAKVNYENLYSSQTAEITSTEYHEWTIGNLSNLTIVSVVTIPATVSQGQDSVDVQVRVKNTGVNSVSITALNLDFVNGASNYTVGGTSPVLPDIIPAGLEQFYILPVSIENAAQLGEDFISASIDYNSLGNILNEADPTINDSWIVQSGPDVRIDEVTVTPATVSLGQEGITGSVYISNTYAANRATAQIDSVNIVMELSSVNRNDQFTINQVLTPAIPFNLEPGETSRIDFDMDVNNDALTGTYDAKGFVASRDINSGATDTNLVVDTAPGQLIVQDSALVIVDTMWVTPDTVSQGQTHGQIFVRVRNAGTGSAEITGSTLSVAPPFTVVNPLLLDPSTPFVLNGGEVDTMRFSFEASETYNGPVAVDIEIDAKDLNSNQMFVSTNDASATFEIQTPAELDWVNTSPPATAGDEIVQFRIQVENTGGASVILNNNTRLVIGHIDDIMLDISSPTVLAPGDTTELIFENRLLSGLTPESNQPITMYLNGSTNGAPYSEVMNAGTIAYGEDLITITAISIRGQNTRFQGEEGIVVDMIVYNGAETLAIDSVVTRLVFEDPAVPGSTRDVNNLQRTDVLTDLPGGGTSTLRFMFDLPADYELGESKILGFLSLDNENFQLWSDSLMVFDILDVVSPAVIEYNGTTDPIEIVRNEKVTFSMDFRNTGAASLALDAAQCYIDFPGTSPLNRRYLSGGFTIPGNSTRTITFNELEVPADAPIQSYNIEWHLFGEMLNGDTISFHDTEFDVFNVIPEAQLVFDNINIIPAQAKPGQAGIQIDYTVENTGASDAILDNIDFNFSIAGIGDVSDGWLRTTTGLFPDTISAGSNKTFNVLFTVLPDADLGTTLPAPIAYFRDVRTDKIHATSSAFNTRDQIEISAPAFIRIDSLYFDNTGNITPNKPTVNIGQNFTLTVSLTNTGATAIASGVVRLNRNSTPEPDVPFTNIPAGESIVIQFNSRLEATKGQPLYTVEVSNVVDPDGLAVTSEPALDNSERVIVQQPRTVFLDNFVILSEFAKDGTVTVGQEFKVEAYVGFFGESAIESGDIRLNLPANYSTSSLVQTLGSKVTWTVTANSPSAGNDIISVSFNEFPADLLTRDVNTGLPVNTINTSAQISMRVEEAGTIAITQFGKTNPVGDREFISTGQQFTLQVTTVINKVLENTTATLNLPTGYSVLESASKSVAYSVGDPASVSWTVVAPETGQGLAIFNATISGDDPNTGPITPVQSGNERLTLQRRAEISLNTTILSPGAKDKSVSTEQEVILSTRAINPVGNARFNNNGTFQLQTENGAMFIKNGLPVASIIHTNFGEATIIDTLKIPGSLATVVNAWSFIEVDNLPTDQNSNQPVLLKVDSSGHTFQVTKRADLKIVIDKTGADEENFLLRATNQPWDFSAKVINRGDAAIDSSGGRHFIVLDIDTVGTGVRLPAGQSFRRPFTLDSSVVWTIQNPPTKDTVRVAVYLDDDNAPVDVNDNLNAFRTEQNKRDSLDLNIIPVDETVVIASFSDTSDTDTTKIVGQNQDSIYIEAIVRFDEERQLTVDKHIDLIFPENAGYSMLAGNIRYDIDPEVIQAKVTWLIKAPQTSSAALWDILRIYAYSRNEENTLEKEQEDNLFIRTIPKALLNLDIAIVEPDGARNGEVSEGQEFRLEGIVKTQPGTSVKGTGLVHIDFNTEFFTLTRDSQEDIVFTENQEFSWWIRAESVTPASLDFSDIFDSAKENKADNDLKESKSLPSKIVKTRRESLGSINKKIAAIQQLLAAGADISVSITEAPLDTFLNVPADINEGVVKQTVKIVPVATIAIVNTDSPDTVSTSQIFEFSVQADDMSLNFTEAVARFIIPPALSSTEAEETADIQVNNLKAKISIAVPPNYKGDGQETLGVYLVGRDINTGVEVPPTPTEQRTITVQQRPNITIKSEIMQPEPLDNTVNLSYGQEVIINVWPDTAYKDPGLKYAALTDSGQISLSQNVLTQYGFKLSSGEVMSKSFNYDELGEDHPITWRLTAPLVERTANITFTLTKLPLDFNSGLSAVSPANSTVQSARVRPKNIVITLLDSLLSNTSFIQGNQNIPLMVFNISNSGFTDSLFVNALQVTFLTSDDRELSTDDLFDLFSYLKVVNYDYFKSQGLGKSSHIQSQENLADIEVTQSSDNPFDMNFNIIDKLSIDPFQMDTLLVLADFSQTANSRSFKTKLSDLTVYDVADTIKLNLVDQDGNGFIGSSKATAPQILISSSNPEESFFSYPNPFGRGDTPDERLAKFNFSVEEPSEVKIRIFTLLGELVWTSKNFPSFYTTGSYKGRITWDGKNGNGKRVLNGTYIGTIEIKPVSGGTKRYITKIAYIK